MYIVDRFHRIEGHGARHTPNQAFSLTHSLLRLYGKPMTHPLARVLTLMLIGALLASSVQAAPKINMVDSAGSVGWSTSLVLDRSGIPVVSYSDGGKSDLRLARCDDANCTPEMEEVFPVITIINSILL